MKTISHILVATFVLLLSSYGSDLVLAEKVGEILKEASSLKKGAKRTDLNKYFSIQGGVSTRTQSTYVSKRCAYIKVDVQFRAVNTKESKDAEEGNDAWIYARWPSDDVIEKISKPYLADIVVD